MTLKNIVLLILLLSFNIIQAQNISTWETKPEMKISGFLDVYYSYDFNKPTGDNRQDFFFNHNRHNEVNLNLGIIKVGLNHDKYRAALALQTGTYVNDNYAAEPGALKLINEASVGVSLNNKNTLWLDAGIMGSYIGFESAISTDNPTLTRSLGAASSPFFITGAKLTYSFNENLDIAAILTNGWQRIERVAGNSMLSFGTQVNYHPSEKFQINWSTFVGTEDPDSTRRMRYFNDFYGIAQLSEKINLTAGFDFGYQQKVKDSSEYDSWFTPVVIVEYAIDEKWKTAVRGEYFGDKAGIIIPSVSPNGFNASSFSLNIDYSPAPSIVCRIEGRMLNSQDDIFELDGGYTNTNYFITASIAININR